MANSGGVPTICGANSGQHLIYTAIPNFPARLSVVVDNQVSLLSVYPVTTVNVVKLRSRSGEVQMRVRKVRVKSMSGQLKGFNFKLKIWT